MGNAFSKPGTNFDTCLALVTSVNFSQIHPDWLSNTDPQRPLLINYEGCKLCAGTGSQLWSPQDTLFRFALWVMPGIVLICHFYFPPLSVWNSIKVVMRLLGDPIDSMWCMLIRQEVNCRLLRKAQGIRLRLKCDEDLRKPLVEAIAVVWMACEEIGWRHLDSGAFEELERAGILLDDRELHAILQASRRLTANRSSSKIGTWIAIVGMLSALSAAYLRTWVQKLDNQTSHTIAIVSMLSHYMPVVKLSGDIGAFDSSSDALDVILQLYADLETIGSQFQIEDIFPCLDFHKDMAWQQRNTSIGSSEQESSTLSNESKQDVIECWPSVAPAMGMNIIFRPTKSIDITSQRSVAFRHHAEIPWRMLFDSIAFVMIGSFLPAFFLSYYTFETVGFGCRCFAWTIIASFWFISFSCNYLLRSVFKCASKLWRWTILKDSFFATFFIGTIIWLQIGWVNSCWCRSKAIGLGGRAFVDLMPASDEEWHKLWVLWPLAGGGGVIFMLGLYFWVSKGTSAAIKVLNKDPKERHESLLVIRKLQREMGRLPPRLAPA